MKTIIISMLLVSLFQLEARSQNRISTWNTEKITGISIEIQSPGQQTQTLVFDKKEAMDEILSFLKGVDFRNIQYLEAQTSGDPDAWKYHLIFHGIQDQVYIFTKHAFIGKTDYHIDPDVAKDFKTLLHKIS